MSKTIEGTFRAGKVEFEQAPEAREGARVLVTFVAEDSATGESRMITYGMGRTEGRPAEWEDFREAKRAMYKSVV